MASFAATRWFSRLRLLTQGVFRLDYGWAVLCLGLLVMALLFLVVVWGFVFNSVAREEQLAVQSAIRRNVNISRIAKAHVEQVIEKTKAYADMALPLIEGGRPEDRALVSAVSRYLNPTANGDQAILRLVVFDRSGRLLHSSARRRAEPEIWAMVEQMLQPFDRSSAPPPMLIGHPSPGAVWSVPLLIRLDGAREAEFGEGYLVALLDMGYFLQLFREVDIGLEGRIEIIGDDGFQFAEMARSTLSSGRDYRASAYLAALLAGPFGSGTTARPGDRTASVFAAQRLAQVPLVVATSLSLDEVMAAPRGRQVEMIRIATLISLFVLLGAAVLVRLAFTKHRVLKTLEQLQHKNTALIEELEAQSKQAYRLASHDHLTGLPNRMLFSELAVSHLLRARRSDRYYAVFFIDLDHFKTINDTLGHRVGDLLLQEVARRYLGCLRESDLVARFGGDEFVMLVNDLESLENIGAVAEKIVNRIKAPIENLDGHSLEISPSIGIAIYPRDGEDIEVLLKHADSAMYAAKGAGRGSYRFYDAALNSRSDYEMELLRDMRRAIRVGEYVLHYQPRVSAEDFSICGLEALVRWQHPRFGLIYPGDFIPLAESNELIVPLGQRVLEGVCEQLRDWSDRGVPIVTMSVNISARQFRDVDFVGNFLETLARYAIPPHWLEIELTESCIVEEPHEVAHKLTELAARGIRIAIDDYGTGFANIGYLKEFAVHYVKIDRSFVREIHNATNDAIIVDSIITLAHKLDLRVVAEGVETRDQLMHLKSTGCDEFQGYYFQRPIAAQEIECVLAQQDYRR